MQKKNRREGGHGAGRTVKPVSTSISRQGTEKGKARKALQLVDEDGRKPSLAEGSDVRGGLGKLGKWSGRAIREGGGKCY